MATLGNVGKNIGIGAVQMCASVFDYAKEPTSVTMHATSSFVGAIVPLFWRGNLIPTTGAPTGRTVVDRSGNINFYDMNDSLGGVYTFSTQTVSGGPTGEDWEATVVGNVVVVTQLHTANRASAYAFT